jgi:hypothetical protein
MLRMQGKCDEFPLQHLDRNQRLQWIHDADCLRQRGLKTSRSACSTTKVDEIKHGIILKVHRQ